MTAAALAAVVTARESDLDSFTFQAARFIEPVHIAILTGRIPEA